MTTPPTTPQLLSPVTFELHTDLDPSTVMASAWNGAIRSIPLTQPNRVRLIQDGKRRVRKALRHSCVMVEGNGPEYPWQARLCHGLPNVNGPDRWNNWFWKAAARLTTDKSSQALGVTATVRLDTTGYRLKGGHIEAAAELALFRHYVATGLQAIDPDITINGNTDWNDDWWQIPTDSQASA